MKTILYILIVMYKKELSDCKAYTSIKNLKDSIEDKKFDLKLIIWNNSPDIKIEQKGFDYFEGKNTTLPKIYNTISSKYLQSENSYLMLSDDDTDYSKYDFQKLITILENNSSNTGIFIPQLYANNKLVSPGKRFLFKGKYIDHISSGLIPSKNVLGMNSGVIINYLCKETIGVLYDERLNFYGSDTDFFIRYEKFFKNLYVLPFKIDHDLSENNIDDISRTIFRFKDDIYATRITFENANFLIKIFMNIYIVYKSIKLSIKFKTTDLLWYK